MYKVRILRRAVKDIARLPKEYSRLVVERIDLLQENPRPAGAKKIQGTMDYRLRVGVYRILYEINDHARVVTVYRVRHRREAYR